MIATLVAVTSAALSAFDGGIADPDAAAASLDGGFDAAAPPAPAPVSAPRPAPPPAPPPPPVGRLLGRVMARGTRFPLPGAALAVGRSPVGETDADGRFSVELPCGPRRLAIQAPRFEALLLDVDACVPGPPCTYRLAPELDGPVIETVVRTEASRPAVRIDAEELTKTPGTLGDPFRVLESLPGVTTVQWPAPIYAIRGSNPGNTGFFLDDLRVPALFHFALGPSVIHPYFFENLQFYPGGYPARYGRYVAGIVSAATRAPPEDAVHSAADVRLFDAGAMVSTPFPDGRGTVAAAARYSYTGALFSLLNESVALDYWDYQLRAQRRVGPLQLTLLVLGSGDRLAPKGIDQNRKELIIRFHRASLRAELPAGRGRVVGLVALGIDHSKAPFADQFPITVDAMNVAPRLFYRRVGASTDLEVGVEGELSHYDPSLSIDRPGAVDLVRARDARMLAAYLSLALRIGSRLLVTPEVRADSYTVGGDSRSDVAPRASARLILAEGFWLKAAGGRFSQMPSLPLQIPGVENFGLAIYGLQSSWQGSLGGGTTRFRGLFLEATGYLQRYVLTDVRDTSVSFIDPLADDYLIRRDALSYGLELLVRRPQSERLSGWLSYTLSVSQRALGNGVVAPSDWDQRHVLNLVLGQRIGRYTVGGRAHVNSGRPYPSDAPAGSTRLPAYFQLDLRGERRAVFDSFILDFYIEIQNATWSHQVVALERGAGTTPIERSYRIVLPSIGVHGEF